MSWHPRHHTFKWGVGNPREPRLHDLRDQSQRRLFSLEEARRILRSRSPSASGTHDIQPGDPLPDSLTGLLTATPYSYNIIAAAAFTPIGDKFDEAAVRREAYNFYFQDTWKATPRLTRELRIALRSEQPHPRSDQAHFAAVLLRRERQDRPRTGITRRSKFSLCNPQPPYDQDWDGWGPRARR